jgi:N-acyl-D-amino-acid deacylase
MRRAWTLALLFLISISLLSCAEQQPQYDLLIINGLIVDGSGNAPVTGSIAVNGDTITAVGSLGSTTAREVVDASGLAVAPGFINMLSWSTESLLVDPRSQSEIRQGVTLEVMGEGNSMGPLTDAMKKEMRDQQGDLKYDITWTTLGEYLDGLECRVVCRRDHRARA